jgi:hypothetical protein
MQIVELVFIPIGANQASVVVEGQVGCTEQSYARVYGVEKHGYTRPVVVPWLAYTP